MAAAAVGVEKRRTRHSMDRNNAFLYLMWEWAGIALVDIRKKRCVWNERNAEISSMSCSQGIHSRASVYGRVKDNQTEALLNRTCSVL